MDHVIVPRGFGSHAAKTGSCHSDGCGIGYRRFRWRRWSSTRVPDRPLIPTGGDADAGRKAKRQVLIQHKEFTMKNACCRVALLFFMTLTGSGLLFAQSDLGKISGFIKDPSGATIANAKVTVQNKSGVERQTTTNESGYYVITNVPPGFYTMIAEATGFQRYETRDNKLDPSADLVIDATLTVGASTQTVEVSASTVLLQTESAALQKLVTREQIDSLELNGRNPIWLAALVPGARGTTLANLNFGFTQGPANFNGSRNPENLITFDGAPATRTRSNGTSLGAADVDSTQEVQILTTDYAPEYGRTSGAQIRFTTKTG